MSHGWRGTALTRAAPHRSIRRGGCRICRWPRPSRSRLSPSSGSRWSSRSKFRRATIPFPPTSAADTRRAKTRRRYRRTSSARRRRRSPSDPTDSFSMLPISDLNSRGSPTRRTATGERYKWPKFFLKDAELRLTLGCGSRKTAGAGQGARAVAEFVKIEKGLGPEGRISVVRFDRGDGINALSPEALRQLTDAARHFEDDSETSVVVLAGSAKAFSAGFDLKDAEGRSRGTMDIGALRRHLKLGPRLTRAWQEMEQITIGAIEGFCIGGGVALAVALDFRVMARDAHIRVPEIGLGMNMSWQSIPRMLHLMGPARTKQAVILADQRISSAEAYEWGLVEEVADPGKAFEAAMDLAAKVAAQPPLSVAMTKLTVNRLTHALDDLTSHMDVDQFALSSLTEDHKEGVAAFLERRKPKFRGR